ncbi:PREDICTED: RNA pseudouridine synthase 7 isoform X2 [Lupinus angustifolius]|uniref:RNA pseudouridine synthase 7 isoform X2 n=1 Tax=Lupinus angustifolius TaxID=3871 RepID=UPI00092F444F|nr:PREDICTED: RNA pseudouridine synthase 7 isoform X2 [Lupinus angustifolius]
MKRKREGEAGMDIVWQTPANPPHPQDYIFRNGIRYVKPYYFEFIAHVKNRWAGKTIVDLFADEFKGRPYEYYVSAVKCGRIQVDGEMVPVSYMVKSSQKISHFVHRHEPPVMACDVPILQKEPDVLTVCKPASVPIEGGLVKKQYIAKVVGEFPEDELTVDANIDYNAREGRSTAEVRDSAKGKTASTKFSRISSNGTQSIVLCEPVTGRTHQIRVHLQHLGHPIANDMLYISDQTVDRSIKGSSADRSARMSDASLPSNFDEKVINECEENSDSDLSIDPMCTNCPNLAPKGYDDDEEGLWLHCFRYCGPGWEYECPYPDWAKLS